MKATCHRSALFEAVQLAASIVPSRTPKPILQCAKIHADREAGTLTVMATDNEITFCYVVPQVEVELGGTMVVPADRVTAILRESIDETVSLEVEDTTCTILGKDSRFHIYGLDAESFPVLETDGDDFTLEIQAGLLRQMISRSVFSAARENTRYAINGILWEREGKNLRMIATDGRRLALVNGEVKPADAKSENSAIAPIKAMSMMERLLHDPDEMVKVKFSDNKLALKTSRAELFGNLVQGRFPNYQDVVPKSSDKTAGVPVEAFRSALRRVALLTNEQSKGVHLAFSDNKLRLTSSTPEAGDAEINMAVEYKGDQLEIGFNPQYILEMLRVIDADRIAIELTDSNKPGLIRAGKDFLYVLMPVTV